MLKFSMLICKLLSCHKTMLLVLSWFNCSKSYWTDIGILPPSRLAIHTKHNVHGVSKTVGWSKYELMRGTEDIDKGTSYLFGE